MIKNKNAQKLVQKRWDKTTRKQRSAIAKNMVTARELKRTANNMPIIEEDFIDDLDTEMD